MIQRKNEKRKPLLVMDINIAPGKYFFIETFQLGNINRSGRIALYHEDSPL